ncbi:hypothetical protein EON63_03345, partial [archaeon]
MRILGQEIVITDADNFTRQYFKQELNMVLPPPLGLCMCVCYGFIIIHTLFKRFPKSMIPIHFLILITPLTPL